MDTRDKAVLLLTRMQTEIVHFSYEKRDGTVRPPTATPQPSSGAARPSAGRPYRKGGATG